MEEKKSPQANLEKGKSLSILMGLIVALSTVFVSFEWGTQENKLSGLNLVSEVIFEEDMLFTLPEPPTPPPPPPPAPAPVEELNVVDNNADILPTDIPTDEDDQSSAQPDKYIPTDINSSDEDEDTNIIFTVVEEMPAFPGGDSELLKFINRSVKYPVIAQENGIQGRVVCSFTINQDGSVVDAEVVRGIDPSLDREALRVIGQMPKWKPGKQRGKPVRVKYTLPISFRLQ